MAYDFNEDDKEVKEFSERLGFGVHRVLLAGASADASKDGKEFIQVDVVEPDSGIEESVRLWFVGGAANISFNTLRQVAVHSAEDEENKQKARDAVDAVKNTDELAALLTSNAKGTELWLTKYYDLKRTYTDGQGRVKQSVNTSIYGYEPKLKPELMPKGGDGITDIDGAHPADKQVPSESKGDAAGSSEAPAIPSKADWSEGSK